MDQPHISGSAVIITAGLLATNNAKTAHGLIRHTRRFKIIGVIDQIYHGQDAGLAIGDQSKGIPVLPTIDTFIENFGKPEFAIIGMATKGGILPEELYQDISAILSKGIHLVNGLHQPIGEIASLKRVADSASAKIYDIRKAKPFKDLHFWTGKVKDIQSLKIAVLGTDCALGKRTTSGMLVQELLNKGLKAEMIYTGQTGWMQGADYGFLFDATPNDFISGELEHAMYESWVNNKPDIMILEGQSALRNPSGPCGSELIISGDVDGVIMQHAPARKKFKGLENYPADLPDPLDESKLVEWLGGKVIGHAVNSEKMDKNQVEEYRKLFKERTHLPFVFPFFDSLEPLADAIINSRNK